MTNICKSKYSVSADKNERDLSNGSLGMRWHFVLSRKWAQCNTNFVFIMCL